MPDLLEALHGQSLPADEREIIVVDDASTDDTAELAEAAGAKVIRHRKNKGSYTARNSGLDVAGGEILAFTDSDCRPEPDWLERGLGGMAEHSVDLGAGRVQMRLRPRPAISEMLSACADLNQNAFAYFGGWGATANLFVARRVFDRIGPFNPKLISGGDLEFGLRAREAGFAIWYLEDAVVRHPPRRGVAVPRKAFRTGFGQAQVVSNGSGPASDPAMYSTKLRALVPRLRRKPWGTDRLREAGYEPSRRELRLLNLASYPLGSWPRYLGYLAGSLGARLPGRR